MRAFFRNRSQRGSVLIIAIGISVALTGLALVFSRQMRVEALASGNLLSALQADAVMRGAVQHVTNRLTSVTDRTTLDTEISSEAVLLGEGKFWIIRPDPENEKQYGYGVIDESSKLDINTATIDQLLLLPNMTPELAASIVDWRDEDATVTDGGGAENEYYMLSPDPYYCKNAPFETLDELRLVKGATLDLLYGTDYNHNGTVDEDDQGDTTRLSSMNGQSGCGIIKYLTVNTIEANTSKSGQPRVFVGEINNQTMQQLSQMLLNNQTEQARVDAIVGSLRGNAPPTNVLDFYPKSTMTLDEYKKFADLITTDRARTLQGRINVSTAPREVLRCLIGLDEGDVETLIGARVGKGTELDSIAWVAEALAPEKARLIGGMITTRSFQYSADVVAVGSNGRGLKRVKYVFDLRSTPMRILYRQDLTHLGWPLSPEIYDALHTGQAVQTSLRNAFQSGTR